MKSKERFNNFIPNILSTITIIIAVLTILFTMLIGIPIGGIPSIGELIKSSESGNGNINTTYPEFSIDEKSNTLTICIDGQYYEIDLRSEASPAEEDLATN